MTPQAAILTGFLLGCDHPEWSTQHVLLIADALCQNNAQSAHETSIPLSLDESETQPFALIAETGLDRSIKS